MSRSTAISWFSYGSVSLGFMEALELAADPQ